MSDETETEITQNSKKSGSVVEWVLTSEDDFRDALPAIMRFRKLIPQALAAKLGGRNLFSSFLNGKQKHLRADSIFDAVLAMELEIVIRPPQTSRTKRRIESQRAAALAHRAAVAKQLSDILAEQADEARKAADESDVGE